jgi:hypothetical protein
MAAKKTKQNPHQWSDGTWHSIPQAKHAANLDANAQKRAALAIPPPGTYDPGLDASERATNRGLGDLIADIGADTGTNRVRGTTDWLGQTAQLNQQGERNEADYGNAVKGAEQSYGRSLADLLTQREQGGEDYQANVGALQRNYATMGNNQDQAARAAGAMTGSGAQLQGARKREANQAIDRAPIDTSFQRFTSGSQLAEQRLGEDKTNTLADLLRGIDRSRQDLSTAGQQLDLGYGRQNQDWDTQLTRAGREAGQFGIDTAAARSAQATQMGWKPGTLTTTPPKKRKPRVKTTTTGVTTP